MSRNLVASLSFALLATTAAGAAVPSNSGTETLKIELQRVSRESALTAIRTLVGTREIETVGEHGLEIKDSPENLAIAEDVIGMLEQPRTAADKPIFRAVASDDTVIVAVSMAGIPPGDLMKALKEETGARKVVVDVAGSTVMIRDSQKVVDEALEIVKELGADNNEG